MEESALRAGKVPVAFWRSKRREMWFWCFSPMKPGPNPGAYGSLVAYGTGVLQAAGLNLSDLRQGLRARVFRGQVSFLEVYATLRQTTS